MSTTVAAHRPELRAWPPASWRRSWMPPGLTEALRERIDAVFLPRPLLFVARLPRNSTGKLPQEALLALAAAHLKSSVA